MTNLAVLLCVVTAVVAKEPNSLLKVTPACDGVEVRGVFHRNHVLANGLNRPYQLSYHKKTHDIYFSNNVGKDTEDKFEIKRLYKNGTMVTIEEVINGFATAIDEEKQIAYLGGSNGVYKMNLEDGRIKHINETLHYDIWDMFFRHHLYFITYPQQRLYKYTEEHGSIKKENKHLEEVLHEKWVHEEIYQFAIDGDDDKFITNKTGLFMIKNNTDHQIPIDGEKVFRAIEINHKGEAHLCGKNGIYVVNKKENKLHEIAHIKNIFGLTFDSDGHIVYSDPLKIVNLKASECRIVDNVSTYVPIPIPT